MLHKFPPDCICGKALHVSEQQVDRWVRDNRASQPALSELFKERLGNKPACRWVGDWTPNPKKEAEQIAQDAKTNNALYQIVLYNIPNRDSGGFSAGGAKSKSGYLSWISEVASGISSVEGLVIVEPDALAHSAEMDATRQEQRLSLLADAVRILRKKCKRAHIYIDAGHPDWLSPRVAIALLLRAGIEDADGVSLNVANSRREEECYWYGRKLVDAISPTHGIIIDTSRNGAGPPPPDVTGADAWANPPSMRIGRAPTLRVKPPNNYSHRLHGLLWVKTPGESDGDYQGAPAAGAFYPEGAKQLLAE